MLPGKKLTVIWIVIIIIIVIVSITDLKYISITPSDGDATHVVNLMIENASLNIQQPIIDVDNDSLPNNDNNNQMVDMFNLSGLDNIRQELDRIISTELKPFMNNIKYNDQTLPQNAKCKHTGKVFAVGIMKTGTTSMSAALKTLGYSCYGDSCIHVGNWDYLIDVVHLWQPQEVINLSILKIKELWKRYLKDSFNGLNFGDSPWCFMYPIFDKLYPNSKFILTKRTSDETYINSYLKYITGFKKTYAKQGLTDSMFASLAVRRYHLHNKMVEQYFKNRTDDLLTITVGKPQDENDPDLMEVIANFLGCDAGNKRFPKKNRAGSRGKKVNIDLHALNWKNKFNISENDDEYSNIPWVTRDHRHDLKVHISRKEEFKLNWDIFLVEDLQGKADTLF